MPYSTYLYLDFHLLCSMTKLKEHSGEICYTNTNTSTITNTEHQRQYQNKTYPKSNINM